MPRRGSRFCSPLVVPTSRQLRTLFCTQKSEQGLILLANLMACHAEGRGFESRRSRQQDQRVRPDLLVVNLPKNSDWEGCGKIAQGKEKATGRIARDPCTVGRWMRVRRAGPSAGRYRPALKTHGRGPQRQRRGLIRP